MSCMHIIGDGVVKTPPTFKVTPNGKKYALFSISASNNARKTFRNGNFVTYDCYVAEGPTFNLLKNLKVASGDRVLIFGKFWVEANDGKTYCKIYVDSFEILMSNSAFEDLRAEPDINSYVETKINKFNNVNIEDSQNGNLDF